LSKRAFLVGINDYYPIGIGGQDLNGCVNDVRDMANTLVICGFKPKDIAICTDGRATKNNIMKGLETLISRSKGGDSLVFFYSGHGSQVPNYANGDQEIDSQDEVLCPHDMDFTNTFIADDELFKTFSKLPEKVNLEVLLDCCHSGTATREVILNTQSLLELSTKDEFPSWEEINKQTKILTPRYMDPPLDIKFHLEYNPELTTKGILKQKGKKRDISIANLNHTLWSGCRDNQLSYETDLEGIRRGVFTYHICQILRKNNGDISREKLYKLLNAAVQKTGYKQNPQLELTKTELLDKPFF
jgi:metacaspase-1